MIMYDQTTYVWTYITIHVHNNYICNYVTTYGYN